MPFLISGGDLLDHFFFSDDCGLSADAPDLSAEGACGSHDEDTLDTGSVIEDSVEAAEGVSAERRFNDISEIVTMVIGGA